MSGPPRSRAEGCRGRERQQFLRRVGRRSPMRGARVSNCSRPPTWRRTSSSALHSTRRRRSESVRSRRGRGRRPRAPDERPRLRYAMGVRLDLRRARRASGRRRCPADGDTTHLPRRHAPRPPRGRLGRNPVPQAMLGFPAMQDLILINVHFRTLRPRRPVPRPRGRGPGTVRCSTSSTCSVSEGDRRCTTFPLSRPRRATSTRRRSGRWRGRA